MTPAEFQDVMYRAQVQDIQKNTPDFYAKHPEYLNRYGRVKTVEDIVAEEIDALGEEPDWAEISNGKYDGHTVKVVASYGGEGKGEEYWIVFDVDGQLFRKSGFYSSYEGVDWSYGDLDEVEPHTVSVTKYIKVKK